MKYKDLVKQLKKTIDEDIEKGINKLPCEQEIGEAYQVSRQTVRRALALLREEGLVESRRGSGSYITGRRSFAGGSRIAVLLTNRTEYIYPKVLSDIHLALSEAGFTEEVHATGNRTFEERQILLRLLSDPPRGMIVEGCRSALPNPNLDLYLQLKNKGVAMVFLFNCYRDFPDIPCIKGDNAGGGRILAGHLLEMGCQKIGGIFKFDDLQGMERYAGFARAMAEHGLPFPDESAFWVGSSDMDSLRTNAQNSRVETFLRTHAEDLDALICYNDEVAYHAVRLLSRYGIKVPKDLAIAAFDNSYFSSVGSVPITTLSHEDQKMGALAANAVVRLAKGLPVSAMEVPWKLSARESTQGRQET